MMTIVILISVIIGMLAGYFVIREIFEGNMGVFESAAGLGIKLGLCLLLIFCRNRSGNRGQRHKQL